MINQDMLFFIFLGAVVGFVASVISVWLGVETFGLFEWVFIGARGGLAARLLRFR